MRERVLVLYNLPSEEAQFRVHAAASDDGVIHAVQHVAEALGRRGVAPRVAGVRRLTDVPAALAAGDESVVFNLVERLDGGANDANYVPAVIRALGRACTGGDTASLLLTQDKNLAKARLAAHGVIAPLGVVVPVGAQASVDALPEGPLFVKPLGSDGSEGIDAGSLVRERAQLPAAVARVHAQCGQPALVEAFIAGREFNLAVMEQDNEPLALPPAEIDFSLFPEGKPHFVDYTLKWTPGAIAGRVSPRRVPADVDAATNARLRELACRAWRACGCRGYARVDTRMDARGEIFVLEINVNCDLSPMAGFPAALAAAGISFEDFSAQMVAESARHIVLGKPMK